MVYKKEDGKMSWSKIGLFALGTLFGSAGIRVLSSRDAKKVYTHCTAAALRAKDAVMDQVTTLQENCSDIYADAKAINEERRAKNEEAVIEDEILEETCAEEAVAEVTAEENAVTE
ncbi:MAG: DUF6110 family protein [Eubacterium sp.]|nr:DUF6110 family protein [Eubacterium sp.]